MMNSNQLRDHIGKILIQEGRDRAIGVLDRLLGKTGNAPKEPLEEKLRHLPVEAQRIAERLALRIIDTTLSRVFTAVEENAQLDLVVTAGVVTSSLRDASDGFFGELYSDEGWIFRFSKKRKEYL